MPQTTTGLKQIANIILPVSDQDRALDFYVGKLGFEKRTDVPFGNGDRWIEVAPAGSDTVIAPMPPRPGEAPSNKQVCVSFSVDDVDATYESLTGLGVDVDEIIGGEGPVPRMFFFRDPDGNNLLAVQLSDA